MADFMTMSVEQFHAQPDATAQYWVLLGLWRAAKEKLAEVKDEELTYRNLLGAVTFLNPEPGTNTHVFGEGKKAARITLKLPVNRKVDPAAIQACIATLRETIGARADTVVRWKPDLALTEYNTLTEDQKLILAPAIITFRGQIQLDFKDAS